jgi:hypothetical protein
VLIGTLFVLLSASFKPDALGPQLWPMLLTAVLLGTVVRPLAVQLALLGSQVPMRERLYLGLVSPRGIISLATAAYGVLLLGGDAQGEGLLTTIFLVVLVSGSAATLLGKPLAGWLKVESRPETSGLIIIGLNRFAKELASAVSRHVPVVFFDPRMDMCEIIRGEGQKSFCTDLFDEEIYEEAVHEGYTRLMAVTLDDALNKLAVQTAGRQLGRGHVFRAEVADPGKVARMPGHQAQLAFGGDFLLKEAANALENGEGVIEERDYHGEEGVTPLLYVRGGGVCVAGKRRGPGRAICFVLRSSAKRG